jgi:YHS domain-containing protein
MILRLILIGLLIYVLFKVASMAIRTFKAQRSEGRDRVPLSDRKVSEMVRDPVCGVYIAPNEALSVVDQGRKVHFCSAECRQQYIVSHQT